MSKFLETLDLFNEEYRTCGSNMKFFSFLDTHTPQWKEELRDPEVWLPFFEYDLKLYRTDFYAMALDMFDIIDNNDVLVAVWNSEKCNDWYKLVAIRRLRLLDEATYLPQYVDWFQNRTFDGWWLFGINELFDFDHAVDAAKEMVLSSTSSQQAKDMGMKYLSENACALWDKYPKIIRQAILEKHNYTVFTECNKDMWRKMSYLERSFVLNRILSLTDEKLQSKVSPFLMESIRLFRI